MSLSYRKITGVLLLDKPKGISSNYALQEVKRIFIANKAGYTGTLDPLATGMLPICFGEATKFAQYLTNANKRYLVVAKLGKRTNTSDAYGVVVKECPINFNQKNLYDALESFKGNILQVPSIFSALKYKGSPLYKYAHKGIFIERKSRLITIHELRLIRWNYDELELEINCSKGTYIRTLVDDLGEKLGCSAYVIALRRLQVANCCYNKMITLDQLYRLFSVFIKTGISLKNFVDQLLLPIDSQLSHLPMINLPSFTVTKFKQGQLIFFDELLPKGFIRITEGKLYKFIGIAKVTNDNYIVLHRLLNND
ncbi:tRNA pseudouridine(55) synthase TruB [Candidatus Pantoea edessiphila]|uniref:tRNA pseudouridine synthase B n=1 Tax=Candidatus Pantoea edessiphila TaxID=2044610 RepID=A0A2P5SY66_9GAMM|nr:tRNA pseudouridine(55) synthase TruB [Candidatus Pantoea edessiphila]MBK4775635.1 tRNA pseudouridine(55) synthase TruB [Pantoea sp. Edef]PPI87281.1 tRNA pseudouridine(55) synthase TruB [Candidatus Pantoea edessiphila]